MPSKKTTDDLDLTAVVGLTPEMEAAIKAAAADGKERKRLSSLCASALNAMRHDMGGDCRSISAAEDLCSAWETYAKRIGSPIRLSASDSPPAGVTPVTAKKKG